MTSAQQPPVSLEDIKAARLRLQGVIRPTPTEASPTLSALSGVPVHLKLEHHQISGSFKFRGASNAVAQLTQAEREAGVVGVSTGNHGRGLARACANAGVRCVVVMSDLVPANKVAAIQREGATVHIRGKSQDDADRAARALVAEGLTLIPPFDDRAIIAGQGTLGLEMIDAVPDLHTVLVQLSGGGLASGIAAALKAHNPAIKVIGISMERGAAMHESLRNGQPVEVTELPTLADSLGGGIGLDNQLTFGMVQSLVDDVILLDEAEIAEGVRHCYWHEGQIVEGAGAVGVAALLARKVSPAGPTLALLTGANIDMDLHHRIVAGETPELLHTDAPCP
ncbi:hydroxyectoine utilization dehydratase EutB [Meridianimarinicoccus aquatilis]|uniref:Hydroxyectoine utilization dehydratase EutB n=1 Tax=Meridianimarinicoccus aquatilis TaxID=2552766 RepID=A0A4R6AZZ0_9RHOB|nr:hydroxyectoine utilization dehydratase EutB [Fluviibacterium aquatile]TDL88036.1 hydroxyectoine utilization dehydratase EutB [Fluviibacterium aquatile]